MNVSRLVEYGTRWIWEAGRAPGNSDKHQKKYLEQFKKYISRYQIFLFEI